MSDRGIYFAVEKSGELADTARSEIALKFNELPQAKPAVNKKVEISLTDQNAASFAILVNALVLA
ncbi:hypothetical protein C7Y66_09950 [Chroococcidiopsis sp. CCALA 051]|uniref:hypothetical protein n=1 Tax=Chroococcidiopsis sp. CCALA 051 TaxID=869949 RepID=UPI000D0D22C9|nr:hypothetical protein [Chroococcidiopsis sp. CCALA 051]PSM49325.1 hypothetical protein C7Y66_09950 [Chroococcidiopsis sp. CCALA 051]